MYSRATRTLIAVIMLAMVSPAWSDEPVEPVPDDLFEGALERQVEMTLEDALDLALERNLNLLVERRRYRQSLLSIQEALGIFDFQLNANTGFNENSEAPRSSLDDPEDAESLTTENVTANVDLSQLLGYGGEIALGFDNSRFTSTNRTTLVNPRFDTDLSISYSQPLLRGFGRTLTRQGIILARNQSEISGDQLRLRVEDVIQRVNDTYWDLVEARNQLQVAEDSLKLAQELHEMNILREEAGVLAPLEVTRSEADVAAQEEEIISRRAEVEDRTDELRGLFDLQRGVYWDAEIVPVTKPEVDPVEIDLEEAVEIALAERPELASQRVENENLAISAHEARNGVKPRLDLRASWSVNAFGGTTTELVDDEEVVVKTDYFDTVGDLFRRDFEGWNLSLNFSYPLQNRSAKARRAQAELALDEGDLALRELEQEILIDVRGAVRAVETQARQIESARRSSELAAKTLEVEELSYRSGQTSGFEILESQERLREARSREVGATTGYRRALTQYYRAIGKLLEVNGIELKTDEESL